jgi:chromate reductase
MYLNMYPLQQPEFYMADLKAKFNALSELNDEDTRRRIEQLWGAFIPWIEKSDEVK